MISENEVQKALDYVRDNAGAAAQAKANMKHIEQYRKSKKAVLRLESDAKTEGGKDDYAYSHKEYIELLCGYKFAVEENERWQYMMQAALTKIEVWRTQGANQRANI